MANVPDVPGVPPLSSYSDELLTLLTGDADGILVGATQTWGLYLNGALVITADTVTSFSYKQEWALSDYPIEQGSFETYDKVYTPFEVRIRFVAGGSESNRQSLLSSIAAVAGSLDLFDAVTPEATYSSVNISHYDYSRASNQGLGLLVVDVWCSQIRITGTASPASLDNTQSPSGADAVSGGSVQTQLPSQAQTAAALNVQL